MGHLPSTMEPNKTPPLPEAHKKDVELSLCGVLTMTLCVAYIVVYTVYSMRRWATSYTTDSPAPEINYFAFAPAVIAALYLMALPMMFCDTWCCRPRPRLRTRKGTAARRPLPRYIDGHLD